MSLLRRMFLEYMKSSVFGIESSYVLDWRPELAFSCPISSEGAVPNGIEISPDGETVFVSDGSLLIGTFAGDRIVRVIPQQGTTGKSTTGTRVGDRATLVANSLSRTQSSRPSMATRQSIPCQSSLPKGGGACRASGSVRAWAHTTRTAAQRRNPLMRLLAEGPADTLLINFCLHT